MKSNIKYFIPVLIVFIILVIIKLVAPKPVDWTESFSSNDKIPFGSYVLYNILPDLFEGSAIHTITFPVYNTVKNKYFLDKNYIIIANRFDPDELDIQYLFDFAGDGNNIFISAGYFGNKFSDSLMFNLNYRYFIEDTLKLYFTDSELNDNNGTLIKSAGIDANFSELDTSNVLILGKDETDNANFVKYNIGRGSILVHTIPHAFANYNVLKDDGDYISKCLSYLPDGDIFWDEYYKDVNKYNSTPLRYILNNTQLKWSYLTLIFSVAIFVLFKGKRTQRIIPVIQPYTNTTIEFIETIGNLYFRQKNHKNIAEKKINYFMDYLRNRYSINIMELNDEAKKAVSSKTNYSEADTFQLFLVLKTVRWSKNVDGKSLLNLNNEIEIFYKKTGGYGT